MEKYGVENDALVDGLRNEEHLLMREISQYMSGRKTAGEENNFLHAQNRLQAIRDKIMDLDMKKGRTPLV